MVCYEYETFTTKTPLLPHVPRAYVLTMAGSRRLGTTAFRRLCRLAVTTVVQTNHRAAATCTKPQCTQKSHFDLVHAYQTACRHAADVRAPVLFLEDDALVRPDARAEEFASVDAFLATRDCDVYTLGSIGLVPPWGAVDEEHYRLLVLCHTQATIWSPETRARLLASDVADIPHIDAHFLTRQRHKYMFHRPLVLQTFPPTENSTLWCVRCRDDALGHVEKWGAAAWARWYRTGLALDRAPLPGWDTLNALSHRLFACLVCLVVLACGSLLWLWS